MLGRLLALALALPVLFACGGGEATTRPATHDDFRAIQREESTIDVALEGLRRPETPCETAGIERTHACSGAEAICRIARETEDLDARARCRTAEDACREAESLATARCPAASGG